MTYEVVVDEQKVASNSVTMEDLELTVVEDKKKINFHQVDCYFYAKVKQTQERTTDFLSSSRWREGEQYWLSDGGKYVEWGHGLNGILAVNGNLPGPIVTVLSTADLPASLLGGDAKKMFTEVWAHSVR